MYAKEEFIPEEIVIAKKQLTQLSTLKDVSLQLPWEGDIGANL